ncbi:MAG: oxidoreductase [Candidatus Pelagibacter sp. TMED253]|nr:MAG: oxidoreductase [Candidatus Pelagibacter sp. TMED253]
MKNLNIFCFGFGQVAKSFIKKIKTEKIPFELSVTSRNETEIKTFENISYQSFNFSEKKFDKNLIKKLEDADHILVSIAPINGKDIVVKHFKNKFNSTKYKWITYLSATSVYGDHNGKWVNEKSETKPTSLSGKERLKAEQTWIKLFNEYNLPSQIFRLSGIYSNQHNVLNRLRSGEVKIVDKKNHFFSRIHVEDIANVLYKSLNTSKKVEVFNISDDKPASNKEVIMHGVNLLGIKKPQTIKVNDIKSEMLKKFYRDSKRVNNKKMKKFFKLKLKFPTYVEGLNYINNNSI